MARRHAGQARWREHAARWLALAAVALALNAAWEYAQLPLYAGGGDLPTRIMVRATVIDGLLVTAAAAFGALVARRTRPGLGWAVLVGALAALVTRPWRGLID